MKQVPIFLIAVTAVFFAFFVIAVMSVITQRANTEVHRWELATEGKIVVAPDFSDVSEESALYVLLFGADADDWEWTERSVLSVSIEEYGYDNVSDTRWCSNRTIPLPEVREAQACNLYITWQPGVSGSPTVSGTLPDLPADHRMELVAVPTGVVGQIEDGRVASWFFGIAYLVGCFVTLASVKRRRKRAGTP